MKKIDSELLFQIAKFFTFFWLLVYVITFSWTVTPYLWIVIASVIITVLCYWRFRQTKLSRLYRKRNRDLAKEMIYYFEKDAERVEVRSFIKGTYIYCEKYGISTLYCIPFRKLKSRQFFRIGRCDEEMEAFSGQANVDVDCEVIVISKVKRFWIWFYKLVHPDSRLDFWDRRSVCRTLYEGMSGEKNDEEKRYEINPL